MAGSPARFYVLPESRERCFGRRALAIREEVGCTLAGLLEQSKNRFKARVGPAAEDRDFFQVRQLLVQASAEFLGVPFPITQRARLIIYEGQTEAVQGLPAS